MKKIVLFMKRSLIFIFPIILVGCIPLTQIEWHTSNDEIRIVPERDRLAVCILAQTDDPIKKPILDQERSFAIAPDGNIIKLHIQKNEFANQYKSLWTSDYLYLIDSESKGKDDIYLKWKNGEWEINLSFKDSIPHPSVKAKFKLFTFWYSPIIHGPPN